MLVSFITGFIVAQIIATVGIAMFDNTDVPVWLYLAGGIPILIYAGIAIAYKKITGKW